jgi:hypothetical protein
MTTEPSIPRQSGVYPNIWYLWGTLAAYPLFLVAVRVPLFDSETIFGSAAIRFAISGSGVRHR